MKILEILALYRVVPRFLTKDVTQENEARVFLYFHVAIKQDFFSEETRCLPAYSLNRLTRDLRRRKETRGQLVLGKLPEFPARETATEIRVLGQPNQATYL